MKSYNHLFEKLVSAENIELAIRNSAKGKNKRKEVIRVRNHISYYTMQFQDMACHYHNKYHNPKLIYDGISRKQRTILVPKYSEQVMHHMVVNVLKPIFMKSMYEHSYGSIPNRGGHKAKKFIAKWIKNDAVGTRYCLQMDIKKYFDTVPHDILKQKLSKLIHDDRFLDVLFEIIDVQEVGLPLGFYTSQWLANYYLTDLDHYIKQELKAKYYVRYMDDMVILGSNKKQLHQIRKEISRYLREELGLTMKENWQVFRIEYEDNNGNHHGRPLDFMGFQFFRNRTILRKKIMVRMSRKARKIVKKDKPTIHDCRQMLSYVGWLQCTQTYNMYLKYIKPYISIKYLKRRISNYERRKNKCGEQLNLQLSLAN